MEKWWQQPFFTGGGATCKSYIISLLKTTACNTSTVCKYVLGMRTGNAHLWVSFHLRLVVALDSIEQPSNRYDVLLTGMASLVMVTFKRHFSYRKGEKVGKTKEIGSNSIFPSIFFPRGFSPLWYHHTRTHTLRKQRSLALRSVFETKLNLTRVA